MEKINYKKRFGQNFLQDTEVLNTIINNFEVANDGIIVEVGAGSGILTKRLLEKNIKVLSFEIDKTLAPILEKINNPKLEIVYEDFLSVNLKEYLKGYNHIYFIANIPYYISTPILQKFIESETIPDISIIMVQNELGKRLCSKPSTKEYGAITVYLNYYFDIEYLSFVDKKCFYPIPKVDSALIKFRKKQNLLYVKDFFVFRKLITDSFKFKRKNLRNNLKNYDLNIIDGILKKYSLSLNDRAEDIKYEIFVEIANKLS